jgi:hypothetical protein
MTTIDVTTPPERWRFTRSKLYGWLAGVGLMVFGGLLCAVPAGAVLGVPVVVCGAFLAISFALAMSWAPIAPSGAMGLALCGLALMAAGRWAAPVEAVAESFRVGKTVMKSPGPLGVLGFPLFFLGISLAGLTIPWVREGRPFGFVRGPLALTLIHGGTIALALGTLLLIPDRRIASQPLAYWAGSTLAIGLGAGLRCRFRGLLWPTITALVALTMPVTWGLLLLGPRPAMP